MSSGAPGVVDCDPEHLSEVVGLCAAAFPDESLALDDLEPICTAAGAFVLATADGSGVVVVQGPDPAVPRAFSTAHLQLLAVHPSRRRRGIATALMRAAEERVVALGAGSLSVGGGAPFYLFTGVDTRWTSALCLFESLGYERTDVVLDLVCPTLQRRSPTPPGVHLAPVRDDEQIGQLLAFATECYPHWHAELERGGRQGTVVLALDGDGSVLGAAAHSVSRLGVIGPVAVRPRSHHGGVGSALMAAVLGELSVAGIAQAEIAWTSTVGFYAKCCEARVGRASQLHRRNLVDDVAE
ncbi:MAG: GNAT family N-acetyltransferase [Microthrixaceae bacterium]